MSKISKVDREQFWLNHLNRAEAENKSLAAYAREHQLKASRLYAWRHRTKQQRSGISAKRQSTPFVQVAVDASADGIRIELPNGIVLSTRGPVNLAELVRALQASA